MIRLAFNFDKLKNKYSLALTNLLCFLTPLVELYCFNSQSALHTFAYSHYDLPWQANTVAAEVILSSLLRGDH